MAARLSPWRLAALDRAGGLCGIEAEAGRQNGGDDAESSCRVRITLPSR